MPPFRGDGSRDDRSRALLEKSDHRKPQTPGRLKNWDFRAAVQGVVSLEQSEFQGSRGLALGESEFRRKRFKNLNFDENFGVPKSYCLG